MTRLPLLIAAAALLLTGIGGGLARLGWPLGAGAAPVIWHGPLIVGGFFGTVISLERAAAMERRWIYLGPLLAAAGGLAGLAGAVPAAWFLMMGASAVLALAYLAALREHREAYLGVMGLGALSWGGAALLTFAGAAGAATAPLWMSFLVLTIAGERMEMSRFAAPSVWNGRFAAVAILLLAGGAAVAAVGQGSVIFGAGEVLCGIWLLRFDAAGRSRKLPGLPGFMGRTLYAGYVWLMIGGLFTLYGELTGNAALYDAQLHAVFLGFVVSMIFGHAPMVVPMLLRKNITYKPVLYVPLLLLHLTLFLRVGGVWSEAPGVVRWAALGNGLALFLFVFLVIFLVRVRPAAGGSQVVKEAR
jgi:hypothetical protein